MKKADLGQVTPRHGTSYPEEHNAPTKGRTTWSLTKQFDSASSASIASNSRPVRGLRNATGTGPTTRRWW